MDTRTSSPFVRLPVRTARLVLCGLSLALVLVASSGLHMPDEAGAIAGRVADANTGQGLPGVNVVVEGTTLGATSDVRGYYEIKGVAPGTYRLRFSFIGYSTHTVDSVIVTAGNATTVNAALKEDVAGLDEVMVCADGRGQVTSRMATPSYSAPLSLQSAPLSQQSAPLSQQNASFNTEDYAHVEDGRWLSAAAKPLSTFSIDVDAASYSNVRRFIEDGLLPPRDAVRIEEMVNYFPYDYPDPDGEHPFSITTEVGEAPWAPAHQLVRIGVQGRRIPGGARPPSNLVFLIDVSGSMDESRKLPLLKRAFSLLVEELRPEDRIAMVVYAGAAGLVLPSTPGDQKQVIRDAIERLQAGGSTAGAAGIRLAYEVAKEYHLEDGVNRVILATDGDFNVGVSSDAELVRLIEEKREQGTFLTVLGFGTGNLKDNKMEQLADHGNGNYYYIDSAFEAEKVLVRELGATLVAMAKDVKIQVEFNPARVQAYRLIGYENRMLAEEDFADDAKDAGELGAGHSVTALYEIVPAGAPLDVDVPAATDLRYQEPRTERSDRPADELLYVKLRYKQPEGKRSRLVDHVVTAPPDGSATLSPDFYFASAVASFGMILRDSEHKGSSSVGGVLALAKDGLGEDRHGYRSGFIELVERYNQIPSQISQR